MSLNISGSKYVRVYDPTIKFEYSDKVIFANLSTSRKTGNARVDKETGEIMKDPNTGVELQERVFSRWMEARFVGNAFEPAKGLRKGDSIDIINGWIVNEPYEGKDGKTHYSTYITISEFTLSDIEEGEDGDVVEKYE